MIAMDAGDLPPRNLKEDQRIATQDREWISELVAGGEISEREQPYLQALVSRFRYLKLGLREAFYRYDAEGDPATQELRSIAAARPETNLAVSDELLGRTRDGQASSAEVREYAQSEIITLLRGNLREQHISYYLEAKLPEYGIARSAVRDAIAESSQEFDKLWNFACTRAPIFPEQMNRGLAE